MDLLNKSLLLLLLLLLLYGFYFRPLDYELKITNN